MRVPPAAETTPMLPEPTVSAFSPVPPTRPSAPRSRTPATKAVSLMRPVTATPEMLSPAAIDEPLPVEAVSLPMEPNTVSPTMARSA